MAENFEIEIIEQVIEIEVEGASTWNSIANKPESFPAEEHTHEVADIVDFPESIPAAAHTHPIEEISDFPATMPPAAHTHPATEVTADAFQTPVFANPLNLDATSHKDFKCGVITGATTVNLNNASDGDSGVIELIMDGFGGYAVALGAMFTKKLGTASIDTAAGKDNFVFWFKNGADIVYTIQTV